MAGPTDGVFRAPVPEEIAASTWWWQVLGADSRDPVMGSGRSDREMEARLLAETQMEACEGSIGGMVLGPGGVMRRCRRAVDGSLRWLGQ